MRFCMVSTFYPPYHTGGDAIYVQALARALQRAGHEVEVVHCEDAFRIVGGRPPAHGATGDDGIVVHRLHHPLGWLSPLLTQQTGQPGLKRRALQAVLDRSFDVIHFHNISLIGGPGVLALGRARAKLFSLHEHWLICPTHVLWKNGNRACDRPTCFTCCIRSGIPPQLWRLGSLIERQLEHVDLLLAPSSFTATKHREAGISAPIEVLPLFSRLDPGPGGARPAQERPRYLFAGRITASKGIALLAQMFAELPQYDLWVAGDGDLREQLQARYRDAANIRFLGAVDAPRLSALYAQATATVIPSLAPESLGLVALESFAHATPVVTFEAGACGGVVRAAGGGIVCNGPTELGAALHAIARDPELGRELGRRGRQAHEARYTERRHLAAYLARVEATLAAPRPRGKR